MGNASLRRIRLGYRACISYENVNIHIIHTLPSRSPEVEAKGAQGLDLWPVLRLEILGHLEHRHVFMLSMCDKLVVGMNQESWGVSRSILVTVSPMPH